MTNFTLRSNQGSDRSRRTGRPDRSEPAERSGRPERGNRPAGGPKRQRPPGQGAGSGHKPSRSGSGPRPGGSRGPRGRNAPFVIKGDALFGRNAILESLRAKSRIPTHLWIAEGMRQDDRIDEILELSRQLEVLIDTVPRQMLDDQEPEVNHQGVILETPEYPYADLADIVEAEGNVLVLDHLQDPQNLGTLLRAADASGVAGVVIPTDRAAGISPAVVNSSSGAVEHLDIAAVPNLGNALDKLEQSGRWIVGLDGGPDSKPMFETDVPTPAALIVGSEGSGLTNNIRKRCQLIVALPMLGQVESLNASTAGSIALFDLVRRG